MTPFAPVARRWLLRATLAGFAAIVATVLIDAFSPGPALADGRIANGLLVATWLAILSAWVVFRRAASFKERTARWWKRRRSS